MLVITELVGNAVLHGRPLAGGRIRVHWRRSEHGIDVSVTDGGGATRPSPRSLDTLALSGRGLGIVSELAARWGVEQRAGESTVWASLTRQPVGSYRS